MDKNRAIKIILQNVNGPIVSANGHISRNLYEIKDLDSNFYMIAVSYTPLRAHET